jgi:hypothetical protein
MSHSKIVLAMVLSGVASVAMAQAATEMKFDRLNGKPYKASVLPAISVHRYTEVELEFDRLNGKPYKVNVNYVLTCVGDICTVEKE